MKSNCLRLVACCETCKWIYAGKNGENGCRYYTEVANKFLCNKYMSCTGEPQGTIPEYEKKVIKPTPDKWD